jgi:hypothetical protein
VSRKGRKSWADSERQSLGRLDADSVVHRIPQPLLTSQILLSRLDGDVTQQELNPVEFSSEIDIGKLLSVFASACLDV